VRPLRRRARLPAARPIRVAAWQGAPGTNPSPLPAGGAKICSRSGAGMGAARRWLDAAAARVHASPQARIRRGPHGTARRLRPAGPTRPVLAPWASRRPSAAADQVLSARPFQFQVVPASESVETRPQTRPTAGRVSGSESAKADDTLNLNLIMGDAGMGAGPRLGLRAGPIPVYRPRV
jgi:hypothetical protein